MATKTLRGLSSVVVALAVAVVLVALHGPASFAAADSQSYVPVVLMHGITATNKSMDAAAAYLRAEFPGIFVYQPNVDGSDGSIFISIPHQVQILADEINAVPELANGFNLMGVSQGGMVTRGLIELVSVPQRPPIFNYVAWVSVQGGVFGIPDGGWLNPEVDRLLETLPYAKVIQDTIAPASYWRDPYHLSTYLDKCEFLPVINNEATSHPFNATFRNNFLALKKMVMLFSEVDEVLIPRETGWFGVFAEDSTTSVVPVEQQPLYLNDTFGLRTLDESGRLARATTTCPHADYGSPCFEHYFQAHAVPLLATLWSDL